MNSKGILRRVSPDELSDLLAGLDVDQMTDIALFGPGARLPASPDTWSETLQGRAMLQVTGGITGVPRELLRFQQLRILTLWGLRLNDQSVATIAEHFNQLTSLDLSSNQVGEAGAQTIAEHLSQLTSLRLSFNQVGEAGAQAIAEHLGHLTSLRLSSNQVGEAGAQAIAEHLGQLTSLDLRSNQVGETGAQAIAEHLGQLTSLDLRSNQVGEAGAQAIATHLGQLTSLYLGYTGVGDAGACVIAEQLDQLTSLDLRYNQVGDAGVRSIAENLGQLTSLYLSYNPVGDAGACTIAKQLGQLTLLYLNDSQVGDAGACAIAHQLGRLTSLVLNDNQVGNAGACTIATKLSQLATLCLGHNQLGDDAVAAIGQHLPGLDRLDLAGNDRITSIAPLTNIHEQTTLNVAKTRVADLSPLKSHVLAGWPVKWSEWLHEGPGLLVKDCPLTHPSSEVAAQGPEAVLNYFREIEAQGVDRLHEAKVLVLGEGGAGKTSLVRRLYQPELGLPSVDETTRGIDVHHSDFTTSDGHDFRLNVWDFGGQQIYHATHQFFLTKNSLYVLVDDTKTDNTSIHDEGFKYWLEVVETLSDRSPVLIFQNEKGGRSKQIDEAGIKGRFPNVKDTHRGNLEQADAADSLRQAVEHFTQRLQHVGEEVPAKWVVIRRDLEELARSRPHVTQDEYFEIYGRHLEFDRVKALHLSQFLHDLGVFLHFQQSRELRRTVFLQNQWVTEAVFRILDDEEVKGRQGRFTLSDCDRLWADRGYAEMDVELRALMVRFELCYPLTDTADTWLAPQLLSPSKPVELEDWDTPDDLVLAYRYEFLPKGLVSRLIVRVHRFVERPNLCWASGALFERDGTQVLVETTRRGNEIALRSRGPDRKALLSVIASDLEALNDSFQGLAEKVGKWVPCTCAQCAKATSPELFEQRRLLQRKKHGRLTIECQESYDDVSVLELLDGLKLDELPEWATAAATPDDVRFAIAVSFPGENRALVLEVAEHLAKRLGRERIFYDEWHEARLLGSDGDLKLQQAYERSELVIPFFSEHYGKPWCNMEWTTIRGILLERHEDDAVIPVHLDDTKIPGWPSVSFGIRPKGRSAREIAELILEARRQRQPR